jgi:AcrR family transcriptional regulator
MSSQKSSDAAKALEPKRQRGRDRVAAILAAAAALFTEKGYEAATMTEIAARAETAIGSLYRFFPTKEALAEVMLERYAADAAASFDAIAVRAAGMTPAMLADALVDMRLAWRPIAATALLDARTDAKDVRTAIRRTMRERLAGILTAFVPALPSVRAGCHALVMLHLLKAIPLALDEPEPVRDAVVTEIRGLVRLYLERIAAE